MIQLRLTHHSIVRILERFGESRSALLRLIEQTVDAFPRDGYTHKAIIDDCLGARPVRLVFAFGRDSIPVLVTAMWATCYATRDVSL